MNIRKRIKRSKCNIDYHLVDGSGAGVSINPVAFLVVCKESIKLMPISHSSTVDKLMDYVPDVIEKAHQIFDKKMDSKKDKKIETPKKNVTVKTTENNISPTKKEKNVKVEYEIDNPTEYLEDE